MLKELTFQVNQGSEHIESRFHRFKLQGSPTLCTTSIHRNICMSSDKIVSSYKQHQYYSWHYSISDILFQVLCVTDKDPELQHASIFKTVRKPCRTIRRLERNQQSATFGRSIPLSAAIQKGTSRHRVPRVRRVSIRQGIDIESKMSHTKVQPVGFNFLQCRDPTQNLKFRTKFEFQQFTNLIV